MAIVKDKAYYAAKLAAAIERFDARVAEDPSYEDRWRTSSAYKYWALSILRFQDICVICDNPDEGHAHHIESAAHNPELRFTTSNGVRLCNDCHKYLHNDIALSYSNPATALHMEIMKGLRYHRRILRRKKEKLMKAEGLPIM